AAPPEAPTEPPATTLPTATTAPTEAPTQLSASAVPTAAAGGPPAIGEAPLRLSKSASVARAVPGQTFSYAIELLSSHAGAVELHDYIDPLLEVIAVEAPGASCAAGNPVVCTVHMESSRPAAIVVRVRTRQSAAPGTPTVSQALAQDERSFTASSDPVVVQIAPLALPVLAQAGTPTPIVTEEEEEEPIPTETATPAMTAPAASPTPLVSEEAPAASLTPLISEEGGTPPPAAQQPQPTPTPTTSPIRPPTRPAQAVVPLPTTSATVPAAGLGVGLIGFALILHGARRVRHQNAALAGQVATFRPLHALGRTIASLQRATAVTTAEMNARVRQLAELLERRIED
ncbi:MAG TPA: hypothetical protein VNL77_12540, partial [Roseiflexaceae bacterium]|nr:hypothetical protein [Roseiflexaceae bacterium]